MKSLGIRFAARSLLPRESNVMWGVMSGTRIKVNDIGGFNYTPVTTFATSAQDTPAVDLLKKAQFRDVVRDMEADSRVKMRVTEFLDLCNKYGINQDEGRSLLAALHNTGKFLHYGSSKELSNFVFLKPEALTQSFLRLADVDGRLSADFVSKKQEELAALKQQLADFNAKHSELEAKARRRASIVLGTGFLGMLAQGTFVARLTWWELSWDIMEPITYMLGFTAATVWFTFYLTTRVEPSYDGLKHYVTNRRLKKLYARNNLDIDQGKQLEKRIWELEQELKHPELALLMPHNLFPKDSKVAKEQEIN